MFKKGDYVYYHRKLKDGETCTVPAVVIEPNIFEGDSYKRIKISGNFIEGDREVWVKTKNCELQSDWLKEHE